MSLFVEVEKIIKDKQLKKIIEIGSGHGDGSTQYLLRGLDNVNSENKKLYCIEAKQPQFNNLVSNTSGRSYVTCYHGSSLSNKNCLVQDFDTDIWDTPYNMILKTNSYPYDLVKQWFEEEIVIIRKASAGVLDTVLPNEFFDMVIIDGSEFLGYSEYCLIKNRCKYLVLDDVHKCYKNYQVYTEIKENGLWNVIYDNPEDRNGTVIANRK
jgi:hypothetical protein